MPDELINIFFYGILLPTKEVFKVFVWSNEFYFTFIVVSLLSIPISIMRCLQVFKKGKTKYYGLIEILVWLFRTLQYSLIVFIGNDISVENLFSKNEWNNIFQGLSHINPNQLIGDLVGYCIIFGIYNLILYMVIRKKWVKKIFKKVFNHNSSLNSIYLAIILGIKNLFLIPVSVIYLLNILKII
ncbi:hypothetical protein KK120_07745 [Virgibacillus dakarensis]|nr:hypothetical protein [Virgibacillus dakarensis]